MDKDRWSPIIPAVRVFLGGFGGVSAMENSHPIQPWCYHVLHNTEHSGVRLGSTLLDQMDVDCDGGFSFHTPFRRISSALTISLSGTGELYAPQGALCSLENGGYIISQLYDNNRLQPGRISVKSSGTPPSVCPTSSSISGTGNVQDVTYNFNLGTADNGNVMGIANNRNTARSETFTYDALNRVSTAWSNGSLWGEAYSIDPWGNLNQFGQYQNAQGPILPFVEANQSLTANTQNQVAVFCYDTAGNVLDQGACATGSNPQQFTYNAENQLTFAGGTNYVYDGDGNRVEKYMLNTQGQTVFQELYWYGGGSAPLDETDGTGSTTDSAFHEYVFFAGRRIAQSNPYSGNVYFYFADQAGSTRVVTNSSGTPCYEADFLPYGTENTPAGFTNTCSTHYKFTGYERDAETAGGTSSGNDYAFARYYNSRLGRFMSGDPADGNITDPQTLNKYSYVRNNPENLIDPSGMIISKPAISDPLEGGGGMAAMNALDDWAQAAMDAIENAGEGPANIPDSPGFLGGGGYSGCVAIGYNGGCGSGSGGGLGSIVPAIKALCDEIPKGSVASIGGSIGIIGGETWSAS
jgi:RHS repeat-associated protein